MTEPQKVTGPSPEALAEMQRIEQSMRDEYRRKVGAPTKFNASNTPGGVKPDPRLAAPHADDEPLPPSAPKAYDIRPANKGVDISARQKVTRPNVKGAGDYVSKPNPKVAERYDRIRAAERLAKEEAAEQRRQEEELFNPQHVANALNAQRRHNDRIGKRVKDVDDRLASLEDNIAKILAKLEGD